MSCVKECACPTSEIIPSWLCNRNHQPVVRNFTLFVISRFRGVGALEICLLMFGADGGVFVAHFAFSGVLLWIF